MNKQQNLDALQDNHIKFDYTLETPEERSALTQKIIDNTPPEKLTNKYLEAMADYIILGFKKEIHDNPNIAYVLSGEQPNTGNSRETIFFCWTKQKFGTLESPVSDFEIEGNTFEVGGRKKGKKQIEDIPDGYVVKDDIEYVHNNQVPLWMFGFLY